jgi:Ca2+-binding EF-hand superfamily protein
MKHTLWILALSCFTPTALTFAQGGGEGRLGDMMRRLDTNSDGKISKEEALASGKSEAESRFAQMDANGDGVADEAEIKAVAEKMRERGGERRGGAEQGFRRPPVGSPGSGSAGGGRPEGGPGGPGGPGGAGGPGMRGMMGMGGNPAEALRAADTNNDKALDLEEYRAMRNKEVDESFKRLDGNADGKITEEEFRQVAERMRSMMGGRGGPQGMMRRPGGEGSGAEGGFRRPPSQEETKPAEPKPAESKPAEAGK